MSESANFRNGKNVYIKLTKKYNKITFKHMNGSSFIMSIIYSIMKANYCEVEEINGNYVPKEFLEVIKH